MIMGKRYYSDPFVVKVQKSLASSDGMKSVLVYDFDRTIEDEFPLTKKLDRSVTSAREFWWAIADLSSYKIELVSQTTEDHFEWFSFKAMNGADEDDFTLSEERTCE
jgi:hypothetical protein